jgi:hypothetical protein
MTRISDDYTREEFEALLDEAESGAEGYREEEFVEDMRQKFREYGTRAYLSDAQREWLERIAEKG